jgi:putative transposase
MSHSYSSNRVHLIFSTKNREKRITHKLQPKLWPYMAGIARNHGFEAIKVGGVQDHVHALLIVPPTIPLAKAIQILKPARQNGSMTPARRVGILHGKKAMGLLA